MCELGQSQVIDGWLDPGQLAHWTQSPQAGRRRQQLGFAVHRHSVLLRWLRQLLGQQQPPPVHLGRRLHCRQPLLGGDCY